MSVWTKEIDNALYKLIKLFVKVKSDDGTYKPIDVVFIKPEKDTTIQKYPCVSIYNYDQKFDKIRYNRQPQVSIIDPETGVGVQTTAPKPYSLYYQIDFWSKYISEMNEMTFDWLRELEDIFVLEVTNTEGKKQYCTVSLQHHQPLDNDGDETSRYYRKSYSYRVQVSISSKLDNKEIPLILEREINRRLEE